MSRLVGPGKSPPRRSEAGFRFRVKAEASCVRPEIRYVARFISRYDARVVERVRLAA
jgi:hypothetical protein